MPDPTPERGASAQSIQYHYDVSNEFYALWLDPTMTYSSALWEEGDDLHRAQVRKLDHHLDQAEVREGMRVLDVGCGWGGLLARMQERYPDTVAEGLTLSQEQFDYVQQHHGNRIRPFLHSWKAHRPEEPYDAVISIGAFEHFAKHHLSEAERIAEYRQFFQACHDMMKPGACLSLQTIACGNMIREDFSEFFAKEIFPESDLPRLSEILVASEFLFETRRLRNDRRHYGRTLREWRKNLVKNKDEAIRLTSPEVYKRYLTYFQLAIISFERLGTMDLLRITFRRNDEPRQK